MPLNLQSLFLQRPAKLEISSILSREIIKLWMELWPFSPTHPILVYPHKKQVKLTLPVKIS